MKSLLTVCFLLVLSLAALGTSPPQIDRTDIVTVDAYTQALEMQNVIEVNYQIEQPVQEVTMITCPENAAIIMVKTATKNILKSEIALNLCKVEINLLKYSYSLRPGINDPVIDKSPFPCWQSTLFRC